MFRQLGNINTVNLLSQLLIKDREVCDQLERIFSDPSLIRQNLEQLEHATST